MDTVSCTAPLLISMIAYVLLELYLLTGIDAFALLAIWLVFAFATCG